VQVRRAIQTVFDRARDQRLDLLRRKARGFRLDDNSRRSKFREDIVLRLCDGVETIPHEHAGQGYNDTAEAEREFDNGVEHGSLCLGQGEPVGPPRRSPQVHEHFGRER